MLDKIKECWENLRRQEKILKELEISHRGINFSPFAMKEEHEKLERDVGKLWSDLRSNLTALHAQLGDLKYKVEKLEGVVSPAHKCFCKQCNKPPSRNWHIERYIPATKETWHIVSSFNSPQEAAEAIISYPEVFNNLRIVYKKQD